MNAIRNSSKTGRLACLWSGLAEHFAARFGGADDAWSTADQVAGVECVDLESAGEVVTWETHENVRTAVLRALLGEMVHGRAHLDPVTGRRRW